MSLYNMLFGVNPAAGFLIASLGLDGEAPKGFDEKLESISDSWGEPDFSSEAGQELLKEGFESKYFPTGRFRDIYFENVEGSIPKIILYTRNGGGNRPYYEYVFQLLSKHPLYLGDYDDDFDCTYAYIEFKAPQEVIDFFDDVKGEKFERVSERFQRELAEMEAGKEPNEKLKKFMEGFIEQLKDLK